MEGQGNTQQNDAGGEKPVDATSGSAPDTGGTESGGGDQHPDISSRDRVFPRFLSHKVVEAVKIASIEFNAAANANIIYPFPDTGLAPFGVTDDYMQKHSPQAGGYWVRYGTDPSGTDTYESWSPAAAFEAGYSEMMPAPMNPPVDMSGGGGEQTAQMYRQTGVSDVVGSASAKDKADLGLSVEQNAKYNTTPNGKIINRETGISIPSDEPVFIVRAKDLYALAIIKAYANISVGEHVEKMQPVIDAFESWRAENEDKVKHPTL